ncbi:ubiquinol-cytochrome-c reductase complex assembly factor 3 [Neopsephotus bourkii]|uniref:ubiquinol-cytochrome-c reductase complex assembly factor 3 n=1 Tax=Neopsephotus bourkii TaxID=309878 RepID=UPI002AA5714F|nr:ubiquinol-cytochrome-c reductase complex assembly factor 3 [Neopsephotus bourkii]
MAALRRWALALLRGSVPAAIGYLLWVVMESGDEKRQQMLKELPEANPEVLAERRYHNRLIMAALREAAETNENVAQRPVPWRK